MGRKKAIAVDEPVTPAAPEAETAPVLRKWQVELRYMPTLTVEAFDAAGAWETYKATWGVLESDWEPVITQLTDQAGEPAATDEVSDVRTQ